MTTVPVNLLPWREMRRRRVLRFWGLMSGALLFAPALQLQQRVQAAQEATVRDIYHQNSRARIQALSGYEQRLQAQINRQAQQRQRARQRQDTSNWQAALTVLAAQLPERAWLTRLRWHSGTLTLEGLALRFSTLEALDAALKALPGYRATVPGETRRDGGDRWRFSYQLVKARDEPESL